LVRTKTFPNDTTGYRSFDVDSLSGVIIDVDEFDWAVPGNGIVIWHIDENVINEKIAENKVNTDKTRRGVDVEEADGVQDIGEVFYTIFGDQVIGEGTEEDFWHNDNPATLFKNRFAKDTRPNTLTNTGANSLITINDFSEIDNRMSFRVEFGDSVVKPLFTINLQNIPIIYNISSVNFKSEMFFVTSSDISKLHIFNEDTILYSNPIFSRSKPATLVLNNEFHVYGSNSELLNFWITDGNTSFEGNFILPDLITTPIIINHKSNGENELWFGTQNGKLYVFNLGQLPDISPTLKNIIDIGVSLVPRRIVVQDNFYAVISSSSENLNLYQSSLGSVNLSGEIPTNIALTKNNSGDYVSIILTDNNNIYIISNGSILNRFQLSPENPIDFFILSDIKLDGNNYVVVKNKNQVEAYNFNGAMADNFPLNIESNNDIITISSIVSADIEGSAKPEIIVSTHYGEIYAFDGGSGKLISGFPITIGQILAATPSLFLSEEKVNLIAANQTQINAWSISSVAGKLYWSEEYGNPQNTSFIDAAENTNRINEFFPANRAYNYPNPVYEGTTNIRYYVAEDSKISIKIFDLAGDFVAELNDDAQGGMDNETVWNVGDIQSGVYLARIEANSTTGKTEQAVIKIAVVK
ncbi:MAG: T9SS type A sorting domain-containing protein, partial [Ignavibacteriaceae bacterium]|nr:T9SS type A sorting domain-containing protein [Ignavibacteriaceae bacterium]